MPSLAIDENFTQAILDGLRARLPGLDAARVQDILGHNVHDRLVLEWAASEGRVLVTHDAATVPDFAYERIAAGLTMPGVVVMRSRIATGAALNDLVLLLAAGSEQDFQDLVRRIPLA